MNWWVLFCIVMAIISYPWSPVWLILAGVIWLYTNEDKGERR